MDNKKMKFVCYILLLIFGTAAGMFLSHIYHTSHPKPETITRTDTLVVRDTIVENNPVYVTNTVIDTMLVAVRDTVTVRDTAYIVMEREQNHYRGDDYEVWISGYRPRLDSIYVFPETRYITNEIQVKRKPTKWGIGIQAGCGMALPKGKLQMAPYIGIGICYNIVRF